MTEAQGALLLADTANIQAQLATVLDKLSLISVASYILIGVIIGVTISKIMGGFMRDI